MTEWAKPTELMSATIDDYTDIITEVWDLADVENNLTFLTPGYNVKNPGALDARLNELYVRVADHPSDVLMAYLRYTGKYQKSLPTWKPLRDATIAQALTRNSEEWVNQEFMGLFPKDDEN